MPATRWLRAVERVYGRKVTLPDGSTHCRGLPRGRASDCCSSDSAPRADAFCLDRLPRARAGYAFTQLQLPFGFTVIRAPQTRAACAGWLPTCVTAVGLHYTPVALYHHTLPHAFAAVIYHTSTHTRTYIAAFHCLHVALTHGLGFP